MLSLDDTIKFRRVLKVPVIIIEARELRQLYIVVIILFIIFAFVRRI